MRSNRNQMLLRVAACVLLLGGLALAQKVEIIRADYGAGNRRIDVTQRLREVVCSQNRFRMGNSTFGTDPAPDSKKSLRVYTRGPNGQQNMQEFPESSTIDGSMFIGWGQGNWGRDPWNGRWNDNNYPR